MAGEFGAAWLEGPEPGWRHKPVVSSDGKIIVYNDIA
jgi:hypothetical protein